MLSDIIKLVVGSRWASAIAVVEARGSKDGCTLKQHGHAKYMDSILQGGAFCLSVTSAGVALASANASTTAGSAQPLVGFLNPIGSGVNCVVQQVTYGVQATGASAANEGIPVYQVAGNGSVPAQAGIAGTVPTNMRGLNSVGGRSACIGSINQAFTSNTVTWVQTGLFSGDTGNGPRVVAPTASINDTTVSVHRVDGSIIIPPGIAFGLFVLAVGTAITSTASMTWEEIPIT